MGLASLHICILLSAASDLRKTGNINVGFVFILRFIFCRNYLLELLFFLIVKKLSIFYLKYKIFFHLHQQKKPEVYFYSTNLTFIIPYNNWYFLPLNSSSITLNLCSTTLCGAYFIYMLACIFLFLHILEII